MSEINNLTESWDKCYTSNQILDIYQDLPVEDAAKLLGLISKMHPADILANEDNYHSSLRKAYDNSEIVGTPQGIKLLEIQHSLDPYFLKERWKKDHILITLVYADKRLVCQFPKDATAAKYPSRIGLPVSNTNTIFFLPSRIFNRIGEDVLKGKRVFHFRPMPHSVFENKISWELADSE